MHLHVDLNIYIYKPIYNIYTWTHVYMMIHVGVFQGQNALDLQLTRGVRWWRGWREGPAQRTWRWEKRTLTIAWILGDFFLILSLIFHLPLRLERIEMCGAFFCQSWWDSKESCWEKNPAIFDHLQFHSKLVQVLQWRDGKKPNLAGRVRYHISKQICYTPGDTLGRLFTRSYNIPGD